MSSNRFSYSFQIVKLFRIFTLADHFHPIQRFLVCLVFIFMLGGGIQVQASRGEFNEMDQPLLSAFELAANPIGETAASLGLSLIYHATSTRESYESVRSLDSNGVLMLRASRPSRDSSRHGLGFYLGRSPRLFYGAYFSAYHLLPNARRNLDFDLIETDEGDIIVLKNRAAVRLAELPSEHFNYYEHQNAREQNFLRLKKKFAVAPSKLDEFIHAREWRKLIKSPTIYVEGEEHEFYMRRLFGLLAEEPFLRSANSYDRVKSLLTHFFSIESSVPKETQIEVIQNLPLSLWQDKSFLSALYDFAKERVRFFYSYNDENSPELMDRMINGDTTNKGFKPSYIKEVSIENGHFKLYFHRCDDVL